MFGWEENNNNQIVPTLSPLENRTNTSTDFTVRVVEDFSMTHNLVEQYFRSLNTSDAH